MEDVGAIGGGQLIIIIFGILFFIVWLGLFFNILTSMLRAYKSVPRELERVSTALERIADRLEQR